MSDPIDIVERLRACADDPMWAHHAEIPKRWCADAADEIARLRADLATSMETLAKAQALQAEMLKERAALAQPAPPTIEAARSMGAIGGPAVEAERLAFEAWMAGHCWKVGGRWDGRQYIGRGEASGLIDAEAMDTRRLWAAWRDRAALAAAPQAPQPGAQGA